MGTRIQHFIVDRGQISLKNTEKKTEINAEILKINKIKKLKS